MKYYPLSQIKSGYTSLLGEFQLMKKVIPPINIRNKMRGDFYIGNYYKTSDGKYFTGDGPGDLDGSYELQPIMLSKSQSQINNITNEENHILDITQEFLTKSIENSSNSSYYTHQYGYSILSKKEFMSSAPLPPQSIIANPTDIDRDKGFMLRYFAKHKINKNILEISEEEYDMILKKSTNIQYELFDIIKIKWILDYRNDDPYIFNERQVLYATKNKLSGLDQFLKFKYDPI